MNENEYQGLLIKKIKKLFPGCLVFKNDTSYMQGIPDLTVIVGGRWALLEVKAYEGAPEQPNQPYYVEKANGMSFGAFIYPENEREVLDALQQALCQ